MDNLIVSLSAVMTMAIPLLIGIVLRLLKVLDQNFSTTVNKVVYSICLPTSLACSVYQSDLRGAEFPFGAVALIVGLLVAGVVLMVLLAPRIIKDRPKAGSVAQGVLRGNASIYGLPVAIALYGSENIGVFCLIMVVGIVCFNVMSIFIFSMLGNQKSNPKKVLLAIGKNPNIWGILIGLALNLLRVKVPSMLYDPINAVGKMVTPLCFIGIGSSFSLMSLRNNSRYICAVSLGKLVLYPLVAVTLAALLGFRGEVLLSFLAIFAMPCAVASYAMAERLGGDGPLAAQCVMVTSILSILTIFLWLFALKSLQLL